MNGERRSSPGPSSPSLIAIGASLGGVKALEVLLPRLDLGFEIPVVIVLHRHMDSGDVLVRQIGRSTPLPVCEPDDKQPIDVGVYVAPADYHLIIERGWFGLSIDGPVCHARPSIDVTFETAADSYGSRVMAVVLTGANDDGASGVARIVAAGGQVVVQDPATAEAPRMPRAALAAGGTRVLDLDGIGDLLAGLSGSGPRHPR